MLACNRPDYKFEDDLKAYADGELSRLRRFAVRRHLTHCASCREEISAMTQLTEELRASEPDAPLSSELREKILGTHPAQAPAVAPAVEAPRAGAGGPLRSELLQSKVVGSRKPLAWVLACSALAAWFVVFPIYRYNLLHATHANRIFTADYEGRETQIKVFKRTVPSVLNSAASASAPALRLEAADPLQRQVHKEATLGVQVPNPEAAGDTVATLVTETGGYVASNTLDTGSDGLKTAELVVKVPVTQFDTFLRQVAKLGAVQSKNITGEDITEKTSDADQTENVLEDDMRQSQARLKALGSKAKWSDTQAARDLKIQLAQAQARLVLLRRMAALSTVTIDLTQIPKAVVVPPVTGGFLTGLKNTTHDALQSLLSSGGALLSLVIWLLAYAPLWVPMLLIGRYALKEYRKRQVV